MPTRSKGPKDHDFATVARRGVEQAIGERLDRTPLVRGTLEITEKNPAAVEVGRMGSAKGGKARAAAPELRAKIARKAANARWRPKPQH